jgi:4a-hydroxytetrahydrobiopterin dehydratase
MWQEDKNQIYIKLKCKDFEQAIEFINRVSKIASKQNHHPTIKNTYNVVELWLSTHEAGDTVTEKDRVLAKEIGELINQLGIKQI